MLRTDVEYYIKKPIDDEYFYYTIKNLVGLLSRNRRISPLTGLPGNVQIQTEMKKRLLNKETFASKTALHFGSFKVSLIFFILSYIFF